MSFFGSKKKATPDGKRQMTTRDAKQKTAPRPVKAAPAGGKKPPGLKTYLEGVGAKKKGLETALKQNGIKISLYAFVRNMFFAGLALGAVIGITMILLFSFWD